MADLWAFEDFAKKTARKVPSRTPQNATSNKLLAVLCFLMCFYLLSFFVMTELGSYGIYNPESWIVKCVKLVCVKIALQSQKVTVRKQRM